MLNDASIYIYFFFNVGSWYEPQVVRFAGQLFYPLSHLLCPMIDKEGAGPSSGETVNSLGESLCPEGICVLEGGDRCEQTSQMER